MKYKIDNQKLLSLTLIIGSMACGLICISRFVYNTIQNQYIIYIAIVIFILLTIAVVFFSNRRTISERDEIEKDITFIEKERKKINCHTKEHDFVNGICDCCGCTVSTIMYYKIWNCSIGDLNENIENAIKENVNAIFKSFENSITWIIVTLLSAYFMTRYGQEKITIFEIDIPKETSGIVTFGVLCGVNFKILHLFQNLKQSLNIIKPKTDLITMKIRLHVWAMNPFAETEGLLGIFINNFGFTLMLILWWFGTQLGLQLGEKVIDNRLIFSIISILFVFYLILGLVSLFLIINLLFIICKNKVMIKMKLITTILAIPIGAFLLRYLFF